jgi:hypothetical protein
MGPLLAMRSRQEEGEQQQQRSEQLEIVHCRLTECSCQRAEVAVSERLCCQRQVDLSRGIVFLDRGCVIGDVSLTTNRGYAKSKLTL